VNSDLFQSRPCQAVDGVEHEWLMRLAAVNERMADDSGSTFDERRRVRKTLDSSGEGRVERSVAGPAESSACVHTAAQEEMSERYRMFDAVWARPKGSYPGRASDFLAGVGEACAGDRSVRNRVA
jgi:hypothetical protein